MALLDSIIGPISQLLDRIIPDPRARDSAKLELLKLQGDQEMASLATQMQINGFEFEHNHVTVTCTSRVDTHYLVALYSRQTATSAFD